MPDLHFTLSQLRLLDVIDILVIAFIMLRVGMNQLKAITLAPNRIADHVRKDAAAVKGADNAK